MPYADPARNRELRVRLQQERLDYVRAQKLESGCVDCGYRKHPEALDFDHLPGTEKLHHIGRMPNRLASYELIDAEIAKCEVVCANCHRVRTATRREIAA